MHDDYNKFAHLNLLRRGALIVRRLCALLGAERVYCEFSMILEGEDDLNFASIMVQVSICLDLSALCSLKEYYGDFSFTFFMVRR